MRKFCSKACCGGFSCFLALVICGWPVLGVSEPNATTRYLLQTPVDRMSWGLARILDWLDDMKLGAMVGADYHPEENRIELSVVQPEPFTDRAAAVSACEAFILELKRRIGFVSDPSIPAAKGGGHSLISTFFEQGGLQPKAMPGRFGERIDDLVRVE